MDTQSWSGSSPVVITCPGANGRLVQVHAWPASDGTVMVVGPRSGFRLSKADITTLNTIADRAITANGVRSAGPEYSPELAQWLALRRVRVGVVLFHRPDRFSSNGRHLPERVVLAMRELFDHGQISIDDDSHEGPSRVVITSAGKELFAELDQMYRHSAPTAVQAANAGTARAKNKQK